MSSQLALDVSRSVYKPILNNMDGFKRFLIIFKELKLLLNYSFT